MNTSRALPDAWSYHPTGKKVIRGLRAIGEESVIIDARVRPPFKSLTQVLASEPGARPPVKR
ncbi:MAG TPA: hypothetical protein PLS25_06980, partial [Methanoregulaceae archaeon]|nr:hypothetical protein [Methanoregulaceae archaeon]